MNLTYFGHSAFQLKTEKATLLFDPFINGNSMAEGVVSVDDLNPDVILLTHAHGDHWGDTPAIVARTNALVIANYEICQYLRNNHNYDNVYAMNSGGSKAFEWGTVTVTPAVHSSSFPDGSYGGNPNGFIIQTEGKTIYNLGDTAAFAEMAWIGEDFDIDVAIMPVGDCFTMGIAGSARAASMIKPALTIPVHYNTFPPIEIDIAAWESNMAKKGIKTKVMKSGEQVTL